MVRRVKSRGSLLSLLSLLASVASSASSSWRFTKKWRGIAVGLDFLFSDIFIIFFFIFFLYFFVVFFSIFFVFFFIFLFLWFFLNFFLFFKLMKFDFKMENGISTRYSGFQEMDDWISQNLTNLIKIHD